MAHEIDDMVYENTRAKAQALADVQEQQIENERRRRVAEQNRAAYDAARDAERNRRGGSVFSFTPSASAGEPDGIAGTVSNTVFGPQTGGMPLRYEQAIPSNPVFAGMSQLAERENAINAFNSNLGRDSILSTWMLARNNGGRLQRNALAQLSRNLGMDGRTSAVAGAALAKNGDLVLNVATKAPNGQVALSPQVITKKQLYDLGCASDGSITSAGFLRGIGNELVNSGFASNSLAKIPAAEWAQQRQARAAQQAQQMETKLLTDIAQSVIKGSSRQGGRQLTPDDLRMKVVQAWTTNPKLANLIYRIPVLNEDGTPKMEEDAESGKLVPVMREADPNNPEDIERVRKNMEMRLAAVPGLSPNQGGQGDPELERRLAIFDHIYNRMNPKPPPEVAAFQQRQRQRQMADIEREQARADVMQGGQRLIKYRDAQGRLVTGNGYFHNGRLYDPRGDEIAGAEPLEVNGKEVRGLPSAAALVNGGGAEAATAQGAQPAQPAQGAQTAEQTAAQPAAADTAQPVQESSSLETEDKPIPPPNGEATTRHNNKIYDWKWNPEQKRWAYVPRESAEDQRRRQEAEMIGEFRNNGGMYDEDEEGNMRVSIGDFDYLPEDIKAKIGENSFDRLDEEILGYQKDARNAKSALAKARYKEFVRLRDMAAADKTLRNATQRRKWVESALSEWDREHDPRTKAASELSISLSDSLMNSL